MLSFFRSFSINFSINLFVNIIIKLAWESKMSKFVQIAKDIINIRRITEPNKAEDGDEPVHGFIENTLYPVFGGKISSSEQFQKHHWKQIQKYLRHSYDSNQHCDVSVVVSDGREIGRSPFPNYENRRYRIAEMEIKAAPYGEIHTTIINIRCSTIS